MLRESKYCSVVMEEYFNRELMMTKEDDESIENSTKCWICDVFAADDVKVRGNCHITGKYRESLHKDFNINVKLNNKNSVVFHNLTNYDFHLIMQELGNNKFLKQRLRHMD